MKYCPTCGEEVRECVIIAHNKDGKPVTRCPHCKEAYLPEEDNTRGATACQVCGKLTYMKVYLKAEGKVFRACLACGKKHSN